MADNNTLPSGIDLDKLFYKSSLFDSTKKLDEAGFEIVRESKEDGVTVFGHASTPSYLFKKFPRDLRPSHSKQLVSYERRVSGARSLKTHIDTLGITNIVVPRKWVCQLPSRFNNHGKPTHIVVVERFNILSHERSRQLYQDISNDMLRDLCTVFFTFTRIDFSSINMPFTAEGKSAFIDTGCIIRITEESIRAENYKLNIDKLYTSESRRFARSLWDEFVRRR